MKKWDPTFGPSYSPMEMLDEGVFEGIYVHAIKDIPRRYYEHPKVVGKNEPDVTINKYQVKSRQSLTVWQENGWTTDLSPLGWFEWYIKYFEGRRDPEEDAYQIRRWRSFVARHQGQIVENCNLKNEKCRPKQRQGLLQWGWDSTTEFKSIRIANNAERLARLSGASIGNVKVAKGLFEKSKCLLLMHDDGGFNRQDAIDHAVSLGEPLAIVGERGVIGKDGIIHFYPADSLRDVVKTYEVVYIGYPLDIEDISDLSEICEIIED